MNPLVSIIMPVYNGEKYLREAIDSILAQTYKNFEFIIVNDGSIDKSEKIIKSYKDKRIRYIKNRKNIGLDTTLNNAFKIAKGKYIARMDCDDVSFPLRIQKQIDFLESYPDYDLVGTQYVNTDLLLQPYSIDVQLLKYDEIKYAIQSMNCICHGSVLIRTSFIRKNHIEYLHQYSPYEDYELWTRIVPMTKVGNLPEVLYAYRRNPEGMFVTQNKAMIEGPRKLGKILQAEMEIPTLNYAFIKKLIVGSKKYRVKTITVEGKELPSNFMLAYQTYLYKLGRVFLRRRKPEGIILLALSFFLNPMNWIKKVLQQFT